MKTKINILSLCFFALLLNACQSDDTYIESPVVSAEGELVFSPMISSSGDLTKSTTAADKFFEEGSQIDVSILSSNTALSKQNFTYKYSKDGVFKGSPAYHFSLDDHYIKELTALWPKNNERKDGVVTDQRLVENFRQADWMKATAPIWGIMPTDKPVPLHFIRENSLLEFELAGQNTQGINIKSLVIELQSNNQPVAHWAFCEDGNNAKLILKSGTKIVSDDHYLIGRLTVTEGEEYTIIFPQTNITLEDGKRYIVTLTSQGYHMYAYVYIGGWNDTENGIGIPFQQPTPDINGTFVIENGQQLIAMSYLMRHYTDGSTFNWPSHTYRISEEFTMTEVDALQYISVPASLFTGKVLQNDVQITSIEYGSGKVLELFDNNK